MKADLKKFWESTYRSSIGLVDDISTRTINMQDTDNEYLQWINQKRGIRATDNSSDKLDRYLADPLVLSSDKIVHEWWCQLEQRSRYPLVSKMAINIYSIPAMSSEPERVFSGAKLTVSDQRNSLKSGTIELLECLKSWFQLGIFTEEDLHAVLNDLVVDGAAEAFDY